MGSTVPRQHLNCEAAGGSATRISGGVDPVASGSSLTRRQLAGALAAGLPLAQALATAGAPANRRRPAIGALVTEYRKASHGQGIVDRFLEGYGWQGRHHMPAVDVVALYVDQKPPGDLSPERAARHPELKIYPTIAEALTRGTGTLAVDGVLLIGEHGNYPRTPRGQTQYPRYEFFQQIVAVYRRSGRTAPVFIDKHLSWRWDWAREMVDTARALGFPLLAGSSLPVTWRIPSAELPWGTRVREALCLGYGNVDSYDFHGLESLQCLLERRSGGETGVMAVRAVRGNAVWEILAEQARSERRALPQLVEACLCRSFTLASARPGYGHVLPDLAQMRSLAPDPVMYQIQHVDGTKSTLILLSSLVKDFTVALRIENQAEPFSTQMYLPGLNPGQTLPNFFSALARHIETLFLTGKPPYPVERTLLTTGILCAAVDSLSAGQIRVETPHLREVKYQPPRQSLFAGCKAMDTKATENPEWPAREAARPRTRKLAIVTTVWRYLSHAQHMGDRFLAGYPWHGRWHHPPFEVVSLYVDQKPADDQSAQRAGRTAFRSTPPSPRRCAAGGPGSPSTVF